MILTNNREHMPLSPSSKKMYNTSATSPSPAATSSDAAGTNADVDTQCASSKPIDNTKLMMKYQREAQDDDSNEGSMDDASSSSSSASVVSSKKPHSGESDEISLGSHGGGGNDDDDDDIEMKNETKPVETIHTMSSPATTKGKKPEKRSKAKSKTKSTKGTITDYNEKDVLSGRGGGTNLHPGNRFYRDLILSQRSAYNAASKSVKPEVARMIVDKIRERGGRFLRRGSDGTYEEIGETAAREKTSQALRHRTFEYRNLKDPYRRKASGRWNKPSSKDIGRSGNSIGSPVESPSQQKQKALSGQSTASALYSASIERLSSPTHSFGGNSSFSALDSTGMSRLPSLSSPSALVVPKGTRLSQARSGGTSSLERSELLLRAQNANATAGSLPNIEGTGLSQMLLLQRQQQLQQELQQKDLMESKLEDAFFQEAMLRQRRMDSINPSLTSSFVSSTQTTPSSLAVLKQREAMLNLEKAIQEAEIQKRLSAGLGTSIGTTANLSSMGMPRLPHQGSAGLSQSTSALSSASMNTAAAGIRPFQAPSLSFPGRNPLAGAGSMTNHLMGVDLSRLGTSGSMLGSSSSMLSQNPMLMGRGLGRGISSSSPPSLLPPSLSPLSLSGTDGLRQSLQQQERQQLLLQLQTQQQQEQKRRASSLSSSSSKRDDDRESQPKQRRI